MKKYIAILLTMLGISMVNSQDNNRISLQTGLFHNYFDGSPMLNTNYPERGGVNYVFRGLLYNSVGLQYKRKLNTKNTLGVEYMNYNEFYWNTPHLLSDKYAVSYRKYRTINITYERNIPLASHFNFMYGGGMNYRNGLEEIHEANSFPFSERPYPLRKVSDFGGNLRVGIEYSPTLWITLFSAFDLIGLCYINDNIGDYSNDGTDLYANDKKTIKTIRNSGYKAYPYYFDLSWRFGIGFNFGK
ncbi:hypothetical protein [Fluviicola sp.]|jgi:hypothetical protein|uniref:hypothetical protein n=1 Tax=Fluviicola sp. TaxID=1917219 RepID=UPI00281E9369|nr:hypothetical protein [Fluviicola sp.]MDR0802291.1 hypothetical protein [Fluviicola sp.]